MHQHNVPTILQEVRPNNFDLHKDRIENYT